MKQKDIKKGETYLFGKADVPHRKHLEGKPFTVKDIKKKKHHSVNWWQDSRQIGSIKSIVYINEKGETANAGSLHPLKIKSMTLLDLLVGKTVKVKTDVGTEAILEIAKVEKQRHSIDLEPATPQNDWWPATKEWDTYDVTFTNGYRKSFNKLEDLQVI